MLRVLGLDRIHLVIGDVRLEVGMVLMVAVPFLIGSLLIGGLRFDVGSVVHFG
jgi:hypothetical protein